MMEKKAGYLSPDMETLYSDLVNLTSLLLAVGDALENEDNLYAGAVVVARRELEAACVILQRAL
ncbi:MAG: hypothetical protein E6136_11575 [Eggerthella sp.]|nr:hypothetical protein [Eggerthella sp.]